MPLLLECADCGIAHTIQDEIATLRETVKQLPRDSRVKRGFLYKFHPNRKGLILETWSQRYVCLMGTSLKYYKHKGDAESRGEVDLRSSTIEEEGIKTGKQLVFGKPGSFFTFRIVQQNGKTLRLSTKDADDGAEWVTLIRDAGKLKQEKHQSELRRRNHVHAHTYVGPSTSTPLDMAERDWEKEIKTKDAIISILSMICFIQVILYVWLS